MAPRARVALRVARIEDASDLAALARSSRRLHRPWVYLPQTAAEWKRRLRRPADGRTVSYVVRLRETGRVVGVVTLSEIVRGLFQSAYLAFYAHAAFAGQGLMTEAVREAVTRALTEHGLHRVEANIQPGNLASRRLARSLGFRREGYSERYLKIGGRWRDHERWAVTRESWRPSR